jgi:hypothetical protein
VSLPSGSEIVGLVTTLAPGFVILGIRQWFVAAPAPKLEERAFSYAAVSIVYYALANSTIAVLAPFVRVQPWVTQGLEYLVVPALVGVLIGVATLKDLSDVFWNSFGIRPFHHAPTAWDYAFTRLKSAPFVLVTLGDGSQVAGHYGDGSFAASSSGERDLLICEVYDTDHEPWVPLSPTRSILLCGRDIRFVEFYKEPVNGKRQTSAETHPHDVSTSGPRSERLSGAPKGKRTGRLPGTD